MRSRISLPGPPRARRLLAAQGRGARIAIGALVLLAGLVWIALAATILRVLLLLALVGVAAWCAWLVRAVWLGRTADAPSFPQDARRLLERARLPVRHPGAGPTSAPSCATAAEPESLEGLQRLLEEQRAAVVALRRSVDELGRDVRGRQERLAADCERLAAGVATGVDAMRTLLDRIEHETAPDARLEPRPAAPRAAARGSHDEVELAFEAAYRDVEADLRLEAIEAREQALEELEARLQRRERELAVFVEQAQGRLD
jgi:hypothetical protein